MLAYRQALGGWLERGTGRTERAVAAATPAGRRAERRRRALCRPSPPGLGGDGADARPVAGRHAAPAPGAHLPGARFPRRSDPGRRAPAAPLHDAVPPGARHAAADLDPAPDLRPGLARPGP